MKRETCGRISCSRTNEKDSLSPALMLFTLSCCPRFFIFYFFFLSMSNRQTVRHRSRFFQNAFHSAIRGCRAPFASGQATEGRSRKARGTTRCRTGTTEAIRSCPLPFRTHNAPRAAQGKFSGRRENRCFVRLYRRDGGVHARPDPTYT